MDKETIEILNRPVVVHERPGAGRFKYKYVKGEDVIEALNKAFKHEWSSTIEKEETMPDKSVVMKVRLSCMNGAVVKEAFGGAKAITKRDDNTVTDYSNIYKSAFINALKGAAKQLGIGLKEQPDEEDFSTPSYSSKPKFNKPNKTVVDKKEPLSKQPSPSKETAPSSSTVVSVKKETPSSDKSDVDKAKALLKQLEENKNKVSSSEEQIVSDVASLINEDNLITDMQVSAVAKLCTVAKVSTQDVLKMAKEKGISDSVESVEELTKKQAAAVIRMISSLASEGVL